VKVLPFKIPKPENNALIYQVDEGEIFYSQLHQHKEIQISIILSGEGDLIVGDSIARYQKDDIVIFGSQLPHLFKSDESVTEKSHMLTLFFSKDSFGKDFFDLVDLKELESFFEKSEMGMRLTSHKTEIKNLFLKMENAGKLEKMIHFFQILNETLKAESNSLSTFIYDRVYTEDEGTRMNNVMNHAMTNFAAEITLDEIAEIANMTPNAFCRYFKKRTNKTFFQFLLEIRLEHACRLLSRRNDFSVAEISDLSGFKNISNFNRKFKQYKSTTPTHFRRDIQRSQVS
jgi:AraC-like DNA-binding protein